MITKLTEVLPRISTGLDGVRSTVESARRVFFRVLDTSLSDARLRFIDPEGVTEVGAVDHVPSVCVKVTDASVYARTLCFGNLGLGESFMDGAFTVQSGTLAELITILLRNRVNEKLRSHPRLLAAVVGIRARNALRGSTENVRAHYDLGDDFIESFLDSTLTYSCGYARSWDDSLETLQQNKLQRICEKLQLREGETLLDIGCGYGGLLLHAATHFGVSGVGITLSRRHHQVAQERIEAAGLQGKLSIRMQDHRTPWRAPFDKIVSVGMMEHLPRLQYATYVRNIAAALKPEGRGLIHAIGCNDVRNYHDPFTQRYVFPGSAQPKLSEIARNLEDHGLAILDVENIVRHYSVTCMRWLERFEQSRDTLDAATYDERAKRMWEYYLSCGIAAALAAKSAVYQVLFTKNHAAEHPFQRV